MRTPKPWRVVRSTITHRDSWLTVRSDACETEDGALIAPYHVLEYPEWVNIVAIGTDGDLVLVRQYRHAIGAVVTELPCGSVEPGDASPVDAAQRELREETGMRTLHARLVCRLPVNTATHSNRLATVAILCEPGAPPIETPHEVVEVVRRAPSAFLASVVSDTCDLQAGHVASFLLALRAIATDPAFACVSSALPRWIA